MENKGNKKLIWYILFAIITIIMCYLFCVVYFLFISPYNISLKTKIWPFMTDSQIGEMYNDAVVDIKFQVLDEEYFGYVDVSVAGVNVRKDGYIVAPYSSFKGVSDDCEIQVFPNSGECYNGKILYADKNDNLIIVKCESLNGDEIKMPFVNLSNVSEEYIVDSQVIAVDSENRGVYSGTVADCNIESAHTSVSEGIYRVDYVMEYCFSVDLKKSFSDGIVFDRNGSVMGFFAEEVDAKHVFMPVEAAKLYLDDVIDCYESEKTYTNELVNSFVGFDTFEVNYFIAQSSKNNNKNQFYFNGETQSYTDNINYFARANEEGFFLFDKLSHNQEDILQAESVISKIKLDEKTYQIDCRADLMKVIYSAKQGQNMTIYYYEIDSLGSQTKSVTFSV